MLDTTAPTAPPRARAAARETSHLLEASQITVRYGGIAAVDGVDIVVDPGEIVGLIGPNGAGKTTLFEVLSGFVRPTIGRVRFDGRDVTRLPVHRRTSLGMSRGFQDAALFRSMTVVDVLRVAQERHSRRSSDSVGELLRLPSAWRTERYATRLAEEAMERLRITEYREVPIGELSTGTRRTVEIAALLSQRPRLLLLDEPTAGISGAETETLGDAIVEYVRESGAAVLLIEHDVPLVMRLCERIYVLEAGRLLTMGTPAEIAADESVITAYFGSMDLSG